MDDVKELADCITSCLDALNYEVQAECSKQDNPPVADLRLEIDALKLRGLLTAFRNDAKLWADFRELLQGYSQPAARQSLHKGLVQQSLMDAELQDAVQSQEALLRDPLSDRQRAQADEILARLKAVRSRLQRSLDVFQIVKRVNWHLGCRAFDGLLLRAVLVVFSENAPFWESFQAQVEQTG